MGAVTFTGVDAFINEIRAELDKVERQAITIMQDATMYAMNQLVDRTPVWSGETVRNYVVGVDKTPAGGTKPAIGGYPGQPGTFHMEIGREERRGPNAMAALSEANETVRAQNTMLVSFTIGNLVSDAKWDLIDNGSGAADTPPRSSGGVSKIATAATRLKYAEYFK